VPQVSKRAERAAAALELAETADRETLEGADPIPWLDRLEAAWDELRDAIDWFHEHDANRELRLAASLGLFFRVRGRIPEGRELLARALAQRVPQPPRLRVRALSTAGRLAYRQGDLEQAAALHEEALRMSFGSPAARWQVGQSLSDLGGVALAAGDFDRAEGLYREAADVLRASGHKVRLGTVLHNLSDVARERGETARAAELAHEALALQEETGDADGRVFTLLGLGRIAAAERRDGDAAGWLAQALALADELDDREVRAYVLVGLAELAAVQGDGEAALAHLAESDRLLAEIGVVHLMAADRADRERIRRLVTRPSRARDGV
jgi:ATP/maltotriose-dependent transcriptional regulator MalT